MRLEISGDGLRFKSLLKMIFVGHLIGGLIVVVPFVALDLFNAEDPLKTSLYLLLIPPLIALQAIMIGLVVSLGLFVYQRMRKIEVSCVEQDRGPK